MPGVFLTDFGLARDIATGSRLTHTGETLGTPAYMSPEQARGDLPALTPASDVWALGCVLYESLAGLRSFDGGSPAETVAAVLTRHPMPVRRVAPATPAAVARLVHATLSKSAPDRPSTARAMGEDCRRVLAGRRPHARPRRRGRGWASVAASLGALAAAVAWSAGVKAPPGELPDSAIAAGLASATRAMAVRTEDPRQAAHLLGDALAHAPDRHAWRLERGLLLWAVGEAAAARDAWAAIPSAAPEHPRALLYRGLETLLRAAAPEGRTDLTLAARDRTVGPVARAALAALARNWTAARESLAGATGWEAALVAGYVESAAPDGDRAAARRALDAVVAAGPPSAWVRSLRGRVRVLLDDPTGAVEDFSAALALVPNSVNDRYNRASARVMLRDLDGALADAEAAVALAPADAHGFGVRAVVHFTRQERAAAIADYTEALRLRPDEVRWLRDRATARELDGDLAGALADCTAALELRRDDVRAWRQRAHLRRATGDVAGAAADLDRALALDQDDADDWNARGIARRALGDASGAIADYTEALRRRPAFAEALHNRGNAHRSAGAPDRAADDYAAALALQPTYASAAMGLGLARWDLGQAAEAVRAFERALTLAPPDWPQRATLEAVLAQARAAAR